MASCNPCMYYIYIYMYVYEKNMYIYICKRVKNHPLDYIYITNCYRILPVFFTVSTTNFSHLTSINLQKHQNPEKKSSRLSTTKPSFSSVCEFVLGFKSFSRLVSDTFQLHWLSTTHDAIRSDHHRALSIHNATCRCCRGHQKLPTQTSCTFIFGNSIKITIYLHQV